MSHKVELLCSPRNEGDDECQGEELDHLNIGKPGLGSNSSHVIDGGADNSELLRSLCKEVAGQGKEIAGQGRLLKKIMDLCIKQQARTSDLQRKQELQADLEDETYIDPGDLQALMRRVMRRKRISYRMKEHAIVPSGLELRRQEKPEIARQDLDKWSSDHELALYRQVLSSTKLPLGSRRALGTELFHADSLCHFLFKLSRELQHVQRSTSEYNVANARMSYGTGRRWCQVLYCGRNQVDEPDVHFEEGTIKDHDGVCGPSNGPQCIDCSHSVLSLSQELISMVFEAECNLFECKKLFPSQCFFAAWSGNLAWLQDVIGNTPEEINCVNCWNQSPLFFAVAAGSVDCSDFLLKLQGNPNEISIGDISPLHVAAFMGETSCIELLITHSAIPSIMQENYLGETPLARAIFYGHMRSAKMLLDFGANPFAFPEEDEVGDMMGHPPLLSCFEMSLMKGPTMAAVCLDTLLEFGDGGALFDDDHLEVTYRNLGCLDKLPVLTMILHQCRGCASLLKHPVLWRFVVAKWWGACRRIYIRHFVLYLVFALCITSTFISLAEAKAENESWRQGWFLVVLICVTFVCNLGHIWTIVVTNFCSGPEKLKLYLRNPWNLPDVCHLFLTPLLGLVVAQILKLPGFKSDRLPWGMVQGSAFTTFIMWLKLLKYLRAFRTTGVITISFMLMIREVCNFLLLYFCIWCAFSFSLFLLLKSGNAPVFDYQDSQFDDPQFLGTHLWECFAFLFFLMISADFEVKQILEAGFVTTFLFMAFALTMCLMAMNLLIALLTTIYLNVSDNADMEWRLSMARAITEVGAHKVNYDAFDKEQISGAIVKENSLLSQLSWHFSPRLRPSSSPKLSSQSSPQQSSADASWSRSSNSLNVK